jgi:hypothetical protein
MYVFGSGVLIGTDSSGVSGNFGLAPRLRNRFMARTTSPSPSAPERAS